MDLNLEDAVPLIDITFEFRTHFIDVSICSVHHAYIYSIRNMYESTNNYEPKFEYFDCSELISPY